MNISIVVPVYNSSSIIDNLTKDILSVIKISDVNKIQLIWSMIVAQMKVGKKSPNYQPSIKKQ